MTQPSRTCAACGATSPSDHRFCGQCGGRLDQAPPPPGVDSGNTMFFGAMQAPGKAKLILIKGEALDGVSYHLSGTDHGVGRADGAILFPEDPFLSPRHASFYYREGRLYVRDQGSLNGVFVRIRQPGTLPNGGVFLVGEQLLQVETAGGDRSATLEPQADPEGTYFYASPKKPSKLKLIQRLRGGDIGMTFRARTDSLTIGREGRDINFPNDPFISGRHAQVTYADESTFTLTDLGSKNGTFVRIYEDAPLVHGDYVFLGQQLLRVEVSA